MDNQKKLLIAAGATISLLLVAIIAVLVVLLSNQGGDTSQTKEDQSLNGSSLNSGTVSSLSGGVSSYQNLKGLTLRINQIETCNPKVVTAYISVSSTEGNVNTSFNKDDVSVYLDGEKITDFEFNPVDPQKSPLANMLAIDHSGSMTPAAMSNAKKAARQYVGSLKTADQAGVIQFDDRVETLVPVTTDKAKVSNAIAGIVPRGDTAVFDAVAAAVDGVPDCGRKAVIVLTDGEDTASQKFSQKSVIKKANKENLPVFAVGIKSPSFDPSAIRAIATKTGGQYLEANTPKEIASLYDNINSQLTGQFVANFEVALDKDGSNHTLKIVSEVAGSETGSERSFVF